jgi:hypothetical protein
MLPDNTSLRERIFIVGVVAWAIGLAALTVWKLLGY